MRVKSNFLRVTILLLALACVPAAAQAETTTSSSEGDAPSSLTLEERIQKLEEQAKDSEADLDDPLDERSYVGVFDALNLNLGGFLTQTLTLARGDKGTEVSPNQTLLELLIRAQPTERLSLFTALGWIREAALNLTDPAEPNFRSQTNATPLIIGWANYRHRDALQFRFGRFVTPHGIINIQHFPPSLLEINQPQFLRPFSGATIFPDFTNGLEVHGRKRLGVGLLRYSLFGGVFSESPEHWVSGARTSWEWTETGLTFGLNGGGGSREAGGGGLANFSTVPAQSLVGNDYGLAGADILFDRGRILWKNEIFYTFEQGEQDRLAFYTQPAFRITNRWQAFYRFDYLDPGQDLPTTLEHAVGINFLAHRLLRVRLTSFYKDYLNGSDDVVIGQLSATVSF